MRRGGEALVRGETVDEFLRSFGEVNQLKRFFNVDAGRRKHY
jgi:hypothetical protein